MAVSIDEHPMWIYALDGRYVEPVQVDVRLSCKILFQANE